MTNIVTPPPQQNKKWNNLTQKKNPANKTWSQNWDNKKTTWTTWNELQQTRMSDFFFSRHLRKSDANVRCIKLRRTKCETAWEGKCEDWVTPVTQPPQNQPDEITESIVEGRLRKGDKEDVRRDHRHFARCDRCVLFTATSNHRKSSKNKLNMLKHGTNCLKPSETEQHIHQRHSTALSNVTQENPTKKNNWKQIETTEKQLVQL